MTRRDVLLAIAVAFIWGMNFVVMRLGVDMFPPIMLSALRFACSALPLVFFLPKPNVAWRFIVGVGAALGVVKFTLLFIAIDIGMPAGLASLVLQSQAFFTVILAALLFRERPTAMQGFGIVIAFAGMGLIATTLDAQVTSLALALVVGAGLAWAVSNLIMKAAAADDMLSLMVWASLIPPIPLIALSLAVEGWAANAAAFADFDLSSAGVLFCLSYLATVLGFGGWGRLINAYGAGRIAPFSLLVPIFGMTAAAILLDESFGPVRLAAAALVVFGLCLTVLKPAHLRLRAAR